MSTDIVSTYTAYYKNREITHLYPVEFVVRTFLAQYPGLNLDKSRFPGSRILDLAYGDGRNIPLLCNLQFNVHGIEISDEINQLTKKRLQQLGLSSVELAKGHNTDIPYPHQYFNYILACHSCYYIAEGELFDDNLKEMHRVLDSDGILICSLPQDTTYILQGAEHLPNGYYRIKNDPYQLRNNAIFRAFSSESDIKNTFSSYFTDFCIGFCNDNFYGLHQNVWIVVCRKK